MMNYPSLVITSFFGQQRLCGLSLGGPYYVRLSHSLIVLRLTFPHRAFSDLLAWSWTCRGLYDERFGRAWPWPCVDRRAGCCRL